MERESLAPNPQRTSFCSSLPPFLPSIVPLGCMSCQTSLYDSPRLVGLRVRRGLSEIGRSQDWKGRKADQSHRGRRKTPGWDESLSRARRPVRFLCSLSALLLEQSIQASMLLYPLGERKRDGAWKMELLRRGGKGTEDEEEREREMEAHHVHDSSDGHVGPVDPLLTRFTSYRSHLVL